METLSGYLLGNLMYSSFVTRGAFKGQVLATSPQAGLVTGLRTAGKGQVLFVNLPLTYLKVMRTDGLPMHGFLHYFAHQVLGLAQLYYASLLLTDTQKAAMADRTMATTVCRRTRATGEDFCHI